MAGNFWQLYSITLRTSRWFSRTCEHESRMQTLWPAIRFLKAAAKTQAGLRTPRVPKRRPVLLQLSGELPELGGGSRRIGLAEKGRRDREENNKRQQSILFHRSPLWMSVLAASTLLRFAEVVTGFTGKLTGTNTGVGIRQDYFRLKSPESSIYVNVSRNKIVRQGSRILF
jgi:hypothetical protein